MRSLNNTNWLLIFLLINIVRITYGDLQSCIDELLVEFKNRDPMDDFLIAFLNIKYISTGYSKETKDNEELYCGNNDLTIAARGYYLEMYYILQDLDLPLLLSPQDYCRKEHPYEEGDCIRDISDIGCNANVEGVNCLKYLYIHWKHRVQHDTLPGTEYLSDKRLLEAIYRGSDKFRDLSDADLIEVLYRRSNTINRLSDENLLNDSGFEPRPISVSLDISESSQTHNPLHKNSKYQCISYMKYQNFLYYSKYKYNFSSDDSGARSYDFDEYYFYTTQTGYIDDDFGSSHNHNSPSSSDRQNFLNYTKYREAYAYEPTNDGIDIDEFKDYVRYNEFMEYLRNNDDDSNGSDSDEDTRNEFEYRRYMRNEKRRQKEQEINRLMEDEKNRQIMENEKLRQKYLRDARFEKYGIADASYMDVCKEYIRRKNTTRSFDYYYTMYIYDTLKYSSISSVFQNCTDYCEKYVSYQQ